MDNSLIKILLVDDEPDILEFISYTLRKEGYEVHVANNGHEAIEIAKKVIPNLIILDIMMPGMDGIETCKELRALQTLRQTMIAFLTALSEDYSQIAGFDVGADDYIAKPVRPKVLLSRIKALLRRQKGETTASQQATDTEGLIIDKEKYTVTHNGTFINLRRKEFELLALLASKPGKVFTREEILARVWGNVIVVGDRTVDVHVNKLREKVGTDFIRTIKGVGYKYQEG